MKKNGHTYLHDLAHVFFPHNCAGCGSDAPARGNLLCAECATQLPETAFLNHRDNPVEKIFYGCMKTEQAGSAYFFTKESLMQHLLTELKYKGNMDAGLYLGKLLGRKIKESTRFDDVDCIVPLPLNEEKQFKRGYNQAALIARGIAEIWDKPYYENAMQRMVFTETQTHKDRISRWQTMEGVFGVNNKNILEGKHILLVDDVVTTGATLEACGSEILKVDGTKLSIATVAYTL